MFSCRYCKWNDGYSGNRQVCAFALHGGETLFIENHLPKGECPRASQPAVADEEQGLDKFDFSHADTCTCFVCRKRHGRTA